MDSRLVTQYSALTKRGHRTISVMNGADPSYGSFHARMRGLSISSEQPAAELSAVKLVVGQRQVVGVGRRCGLNLLVGQSADASPIGPVLRLAVPTRLVADGTVVAYGGLPSWRG